MRKAVLQNIRNCCCKGKVGRCGHTIKGLECQAVILESLFEIFHPRVTKLSKYRHFLLEALLDHFPLLDLTLPISNSVDTDCSSRNIILTLTFYHLILGTKCFLCVVWGVGERKLSFL